LGVEVIRSPFGLFLSQQKYPCDILDRTNIADTKPVRTPIAYGSCPGSKDGSPLEDPMQYMNVVGSLQYLMFTRPDVAFIVNKLSQFTSCPTTTHWTMAKCVSRYLAGTSDRGLFLRK